MASYLKKFASLEADNPVTTPPIETAKLLPVTETPPKLDDPPAESNPVKEAEQAAIKQRLAEMEQANKVAAAPTQPPPEPPRVVDGDPIEEAIRDWPERPKKWVRDNPQFITDPEQSAKLQYAHHIAVRETGEDQTPRYFAAMESLLGLPQAEPQPRRNLNLDQQHRLALLGLPCPTARRRPGKPRRCRPDIRPTTAA